MAKRHSKTSRADGFDPYSAQRYMKGRKRHLGAAINHEVHPKRGMGSGWAIMIVGLFVFALVVLVIN
jgi:hypothetical protein